jgi:hypothetical protein
MSAVFARFSSIAVLLALLLAPSTASAWTRTEVRGMRARAEVMPSGFARVGLEITVEVQGGWVERFEIAGLGQGAQLDALKPPTWVKSSVALDDTDATPGTKYVPIVKLRSDGTLSLDFGARVTAPRRGTFQSRLVYETQLTSDGRGGLLLALPTWPGALENVELWIDAPRGTTLARAADSELDNTRTLERGALTTVHIVKAQLPRTHSLEAHLVLPGGANAELPVAPEVAAKAPAESDAPKRDAWLVAGALLALIALKRRMLSASYAGAPEHAFSALKALVIAAPCAAFPYAHAWSTTAGGLALAAAIALGLSLPLRLGDDAATASLRYRRAHAFDLVRVRRARLAAWLGPRSWLDATTPSGLALLGLSGALAIVATQQGADAGETLWLEAWAIALPLFIGKTRFSRQLDAGDALLALAQARSALAPVAEALGARGQLEVACATLTGHAQRVRLRFSSEVALVLAQDAAGGSALAWLLTSEGRNALRRAPEPELELAELLAPAAAESRDVLSHAA